MSSHAATLQKKTASGLTIEIEQRAASKKYHNHMKRS